MCYTVSIVKPAKRKNIVICADMSYKSFRERVSGFLHYAGSHMDWFVRVCDKWGIADSSRQPSPDGVVFIADASAGAVKPPSSSDNRRRKLPVPAIVLDPQNGQLGFRPDAEIRIDDEAIARACFQLFCRYHIKNVAYVGDINTLEAQHSARRKNTFLKAAKAAGLAAHAFDFDSRKGWTDAFNRMARWISNLPTPCGIFSYSDSVAKCVMDACRISHLRIPEQILLVGVDNDMVICENMQPSLTSIEPDFANAGYLAAQILDRILSTGRTRQPVIQTYGVKTVVERASTQDITGSRRIVAAALEIIRLEAPTPDGLDVPILCRKLNVSRSLLERLFRTSLNCGVAERIRLTRLTALAERLPASHASIADVCHASGFASPTHVKTLFKKHFGMTLRDWRTSHAAAPQASRGITSDARASRPRRSCGT